MSDIASIAVEKDKGGNGGHKVRRLTDKMSMQLYAIMRSDKNVLIVKAK